MDQDRVEFHKAQYLQYSADELGDLIARMTANHGAFTSEARKACEEALRERNLSTEALLRDRQMHLLEDRRHAQEKQQQAAAKSKKFTRRLGKVGGFVGIPMSLAIAGLSIAQQHYGGLAASIAFLGCSVWMAFYYQGD